MNGETGIDVHIYTTDTMYKIDNHGEPHWKTQEILCNALR